MCGGDEHSQGAATIVHTLQESLGTVEDLSVGIYGMTASSRPTKGIMRVLSKFGATFYEDPVLDEFRAPDYLREEVAENGGDIVNKPVEEFIGDVDFLNIVEGLPQKGTDKELVNKYNQEFQIFGKEEFAEISEGGVFMYGMPAKLSDDRDIVNIEEADADDRMIGFDLLSDMAYVNMALITKLLEIEV
jgi:aspartate carbamoyltransferase catalytic subunit